MRVEVRDPPEAYLPETKQRPAARQGQSRRHGVVILQRLSKHQVDNRVEQGVDARAYAGKLGKAEPGEPHERRDEFSHVHAVGALRVGVFLFSGEAGLRGNLLGGRVCGSRGLVLHFLRCCERFRARLQILGVDALK